jgi:hypothetical protein
METVEQTNLTNLSRLEFITSANYMSTMKSPAEVQVKIWNYVR